MPEQEFGPSDTCVCIRSAFVEKVKRLLQGQARRIDTYNLFIDVNIKNLYIVVT